MPRPELPPPTEGGKSAMIEWVIEVNELEIAELKAEIEELERINEVLKE